jgi:hypothetical protein
MGMNIWIRDLLLWDVTPCILIDFYLQGIKPQASELLFPTDIQYYTLHVAELESFRLQRVQLCIECLCGDVSFTDVGQTDTQTQRSCPFTLDDETSSFPK